MPLDPRLEPPSPGAPSRAGPSIRFGERLAQTVTLWTGSTPAFTIAMISIVLWAVTGPVFHWSDTWQLAMNTVSSITTFLMVFLIQRSQNKDTLAIHVKLDEMLAASEGTSKDVVSVEDLSEVELQSLKARYQRLVRRVEVEQTARENA